jgi:hypothetical protein
MNINGLLNVSLKSGSDEAAGSLTLDSNNGQKIVLNESIPGESTDLAVALAFAYAKLQAILLVSDQALTLEFNNSTTGVPTITMAAGVPFLWFVGSNLDNPFTENVTVLYVTNAGSAAALLEGILIVDPT